jgi:Fe-Mn family superoxide dismutase
MHSTETHLDRRDFVRISAVAAAATALSAQFPLSAAEAKAVREERIPMVKLPYKPSSLAPHISERTVKIHYNEHHESYYDIVKAYADKQKKYSRLALDNIIVKSKGGINEEESLHYMAILLFNHNLYWQSLKPKGGGKPGGALGRKIDKAFGSYELFRKAFVEKAMRLGSGWVFLVKANEALMLKRMDYHDSPLLHNQKPLLAVDVWEHSYYLDYQHDREKYVNAVLDNLINWEFAEAALK